MVSRRGILIIRAMRRRLNVLGDRMEFDQVRTEEARIVTVVGLHRRERVLIARARQEPTGNVRSAPPHLPFSDGPDPQCLLDELGFGAVGVLRRQRHCRKRHRGRGGLATGLLAHWDSAGWWVVVISVGDRCLPVAGVSTYSINLA